MRILHTLDELRPSGAEVMYRAAADLWRSEGLQCDILSLGPAPGVYAGALAEAGLGVHHIPWSRAAGPFAAARHLLTVYRFLKLNRYDVVHVNAEYANFWYFCIARASGHRRLFRTIHNCFEFKGLLRLERRLQRFVLRRVVGARMIAVGSAVQRTELARFANPTLLAGNWFDNRRFHPATPEQRQAARAALQVPPDAFVLTSVGNCGVMKNHAAIFEALSRLNAEEKLLYCHAGLETDDHAERDLATELGISRNVRFLGYVPDIPLLFRATDAYVMSSLQEGLGVAALEAMAAGVPAVLARVNGLSELASCSPDIFWVEPTAESVAEGIGTVLRLSSGRRREIGSRLSDAAHAHFGLENWAAWYARLYKQQYAGPDQVV